MTTTTPESRGSLARTAYLRTLYAPDPVPSDTPYFAMLPAVEQDAWIKAAGVIWDIATTGRATL